MSNAVVIPNPIANPRSQKTFRMINFLVRTRPSTAAFRPKASDVMVNPFAAPPFLPHPLWDGLRRQESGILARAPSRWSIGSATMAMC
jgi:hypothetical protein